MCSHGWDVSIGPRLNALSKTIRNNIPPQKLELYDKLVGTNPDI
jgi:hypothetical protein